MTQLQQSRSNTDLERAGTDDPVIRPIPRPVVDPTSSPRPTVTVLTSPKLGGAIGCDFRSALNELLFVEYSGNLSRMDLRPGASVVSQGTAVLKGTFTFDLDAGTQPGASGDADIWWEQATAVEREMAPQNGAALLNLGVVAFDSVTSTSLQGLPYSVTPIPGNDDPTNKLVTGDVFAVRTTAGNLAKVQVVSYGYDMSIEWVTYKLDPAYAVLGTGYSQPEDVKASSDGVHAYVTERTGDLVKVDLGHADRSSATVVASGMTAPQQLFLDENAGVAYTVEYAPSGRLWRIDLATGAKVVVISGLSNAGGVIVSADGQYAYISEQTTGPDGGRVSRYQLTSGHRVGLATGLVEPFFLTWVDSGESALYCVERDPANAIVTVKTTGGDTVTVMGLATRPSSVAVAGPGFLLVCCDAEIEEVQLAAPVQQVDGALISSIGFIPVHYIISGLGNTTADPAYFYPVDGVPFGGSLPLMINFLQAGLDGASFYQVFVDGNLRTDQFNTVLVNGGVPTVFGPGELNGEPGYYPVLSPYELALYQSPLPGCYLDSTGLASGQIHTITVKFFDASGSEVTSAVPLDIYVDNRPCAVTLAQAAIGSSSATTACGYLQYSANELGEDVRIAYTASQPGNFATWSFSLVKASTLISSAGGTVPESGGFSEQLSTVLGGCSVAAYAVEVYVAASANTGWTRCGQYDRSALEAFTLAT